MEFLDADIAPRLFLRFFRVLHDIDDPAAYGEDKLRLIAVLKRHAHGCPLPSRQRDIQ
jgi:hypothetical protein